MISKITKLYVLLGSTNTEGVFLLAFIRTLIFLVMALILTSLSYGVFNYAYSGASISSFMRTYNQPISDEAITLINARLEELEPGTFPRVLLKKYETEDAYYVLAKFYRLDSDKELTKVEQDALSTGQCSLDGSVRCLFLIQPRFGLERLVYFTLWKIELMLNVHPLVRTLEKVGMSSQIFCDGSTLKAPTVEQCKYTDEVSRVLSSLYESSQEGIPYWVALQKVNGSIQFVTIIVFWMVVLQLYFLSKCNIKLNQKLAHMGSLKQINGEGKPTPWRAGTYSAANVIKLYETIIIRLRDQLAVCRTTFDSHFLAIRHSGMESVHTRGDTAGIISNVTATTEMYLEQSYNTLSTARFGVWLIPTIGFIGTVVGIANALYKTLDLQSADLIQKSISKANVSAYIGTAFDTTLVALVLSILVMGYLTRVEKNWTQSILTTKSQTIASLNHSDNFASIDVHEEESFNSSNAIGVTRRIAIVAIITFASIIALKYFGVLEKLWLG